MGATIVQSGKGLVVGHFLKESSLTNKGCCEVYRIALAGGRQDYEVSARSQISTVSELEPNEKGNIGSYSLSV